MPRNRSEKRKILTYANLKSMKTFNEIEYEERFFWDRVILMDTIDLNDENLRNKTKSFLDMVAVDAFFTSNMTEKQIFDIQNNFDEKKFNNVYQIFDEILELLFKIPKIKNHTIFDFFPLRSFVLEENFKIFKEKILDIFFEICTLTVGKGKFESEFDGSDELVYMEIEACLYSTTISNSKRLKIFKFIQDKYSDCIEKEKDKLFCFEPRMLDINAAIELLGFIKNIK